MKKVENTRNTVMGYEQQKEECIFRLEEAKASMRMNVSGIM
jgi:hypothetical protein